MPGPHCPTIDPVLMMSVDFGMPVVCLLCVLCSWSFLIKKKKYTVYERYSENYEETAQLHFKTNNSN